MDIDINVRVTHPFSNAAWLKLNIEQKLYTCIYTSSIIQSLLSKIGNSSKAFKLQAFQKTINFGTENNLYSLEDNFLYEFVDFKLLKINYQ